MDIHVYFHEHQDHVSAALARIEVALHAVINQGVSIMASLDDVLGLVTAESTKVDGLVTLLDGVEQQLKDALAGTTLPPAVQAKVDAVFDGITKNSAKVQAAIDANTPAAPAGPVITP